MLKAVILTLALWQLLEAIELPDNEIIEDIEVPTLNDTELENDLSAGRTYRFAPFQLRDKIYAVNSFTKADWYTAQKICSYQGMNLAGFSTPQENERLRRYLVDNGYSSYGQNYWVSGTDLGSRGQWYWQSNGLPITYNNWAPGEPNNRDGNERCIHVGSDGSWFDLCCDTPLYFICENRCQLDSYSVPIYPQ